MKPVRAIAVHPSGPPPDAPLASPVWQVSYNREALKAAGYRCRAMNDLGQEKWSNSGRVVDLEPDGHWCMRRIRDGRRLAEGQGPGALQKAIADPLLGLDIRELVGPK